MPEARKRVLVVDDERAIREGFARALAKLDLLAECAATVGEAIHKLTKEGPFDYAFIDLKLGSEDGLDVARVARSLHVAAYAITGSADAAHHNRGILLDDVPVLLKPVDGLMLAKAIARVDCDVEQRARLLARAVEAFMSAYGLEGVYARRMLEAIADGKSPKATRTSDGKELSLWTVNRVRSAILKKSRLGSVERVFKWLYDYAFRSARVPQAS